MSTESLPSDPVPGLLEALTHPFMDVRLEAIGALGRLGPLATDAIPALVRLLDDPDGLLRRSAARAIGQCGAEAVPALSAALSHSDRHVRRQATWALGRLGEKARPAVIKLGQTLSDSDSRTATGAAQALGTLGPIAEPAIPHLIRALSSLNRVLCRLAARALSQIGPPAMVPLFEPLFDADPFVRGEAARALNWIEGDLSGAVGALVTVLRIDPSAARRVQAAQALGCLGPRAAAAADALREAQSSSKEKLRQAAMVALRQVQSRSLD